MDSSVGVLIVIPPYIVTVAVVSPLLKLFVRALCSSLSKTVACWASSLVAAMGSVLVLFQALLRLGGKHYVRSIQKVNDDGSLSFFCAIDEGLVLRVASGENLVENLSEEKLEKFLAGLK